MPNTELLKKYARLVVEVGVRVQKDQFLVINATTDTVDLTRMIVEAGYNAGAKSVHVIWNDPYIAKMSYEGKSIELLQIVPQFMIDRAKYFIENKGCIINIASPVPGLLKDVDPVKLQTSAIAQMKTLKFVQDHMMANKTQWSIIAAPNTKWAKQVFPNLNEEEAVEALWNAILEGSRVTETNDPVTEWEQHNKRLVSHNNILTTYQFETLHFKNNMGTDLTIKLADNHIWCGGLDQTVDGYDFNPNIPTEENFTMPYKFGVNGTVYATKPLNYQGKLIKDFWLEFKDGKVINYDALEQKEALENLLNTDEGSRYLGEVALISYDSPINNTGILFLNTLFDENASCHLALGKAFPKNLKGGIAMTQEELAKAGANLSLVHSDFMFGSADMNIEGTLKDGSKVVIFKDGNFVI